MDVWWEMERRGMPPKLCLQLTIMMEVESSQSLSILIFAEGGCNHLFNNGTSSVTTSELFQ